MIVFDDRWFKKHQYTLLKLANTSIGRFIFGIKKQDGIIATLSPNSYHYLKHIDRGTGLATINSRFYTSNRIALNLYKNLKWFWKALHSMDSLVLDHQNLVPDFGFETLTQFEGDTGLGSSTTGFDQDGYTTGSSATWNSVKSKTTFDTIHSAGDATSVVGALGSWTGFITLYRSISVFYTGGTISSGAGISSATFSALLQYSLNYTKFWSPAANHGTVLVECDIADPTDQLASGDWDAFDLTNAISSTVLSEDVDNTYKDYTLNSYGLAAISDSGHTQLGIVMIGDREDITPSYTPQPEGTFVTTGIATNDNSGGANPNKLDVTWYSPTNYLNINIGDTFKDIVELQINIGDSWKKVIEMQINVGDTWKDIF